MAELFPTTGSPVASPYASSSPRRRTTVIQAPAPQEPNVLCAVMSGTQYHEVETTSAGHVARFHFRDGEWFDLARGVSFDAAMAAITRFIDLTWGLAPGWSHERDAALRAAAATVLAGEADAIVLPLAA